MLKHLHLLLTLFVLAIAGQVKAQETETITFSEKGLNSSIQYTQFDEPNFTIKFGDGANDGKYYDTGTGIRVYSDGYFEISSTTKKIASFVATYDKETTKNDVPKDNAYSLSSGSIEGVGTTNQTWTSADPAGESSVKLTRLGTKGHWRLQSVTVTFVDLSKTPTTLTFNKGDQVLAIGVEGSTASVSNVATLNPVVEGAVITYSSSNADKASVGVNGDVLVDTSVGGTYTITAAYAGNDTYAASSATYTISVEYPREGAGTLEAPYTTLDVLHILEEGKTLTDVHVKGSVKAITEVNTQHSNATYTITDGTNDLLIFRGKSFDGGNMGQEFQVAVGDELVIKGNPILYQGTPEYASNNTVVSQTRNRTTTANNYGTICLPYTGTVTGGTLYSVDGIVNGELTLSEVATPEAGTPYIFQASGEKLSVAFTAGTPATAASSAYLVGVSAAQSAPAGSYVLQTIDGMQKFRLVAAGEEPNVPAGRAYLTVSNPSREFIGFADTTTAIDAIDALANNKAEIFDLNGRKLMKLQKGVNIVNGTKVIVK